MFPELRGQLMVAVADKGYQIIGNRSPDHVLKIHHRKSPVLKNHNVPAVIVPVHGNNRLLQKYPAPQRLHIVKGFQSVAGKRLSLALFKIPFKTDAGLPIQKFLIIGGKGIARHLCHVYQKVRGFFV